MAVFLLTWNPDGDGWPEEDYRREVEGAAAGRIGISRWSTGSQKHRISKRDRALLFRQVHGRGLVAGGTFAGPTYRDEHWSNPGKMANYADIKWEQVLPIEDRLPVEDLRVIAPATPWQVLLGSGVRVKQPDADALEAAWVAHVAGTPYRGPGEFRPGAYSEGDVTRVAVNKYERDRAARETRLLHHGLTCTVCGFNFETTYGELGRNFIHVHHLREVSTLGPGYKIDPVKEMRPLCANCHAMAHRTRPCTTPAQLKRALRKVTKKGKLSR